MCGTRTENPLRIHSSSECPHIACSLGCLEDLDCRWIEIQEVWDAMSGGKGISLLFSVVPEVGGERAISGYTQSAVPALAVAEQFGADDALYHIQEAHMQRGLELEEQALEARRSFEEMRKRMLEQSIPSSVNSRPALEQGAAQSIIGEAIIEKYGKTKKESRCYICYSKTKNPLRLSRSRDCPHSACSLRCLNDLHCRWVEIAAALVQDQQAWDAMGGGDNGIGPSRH